MKIILNQLKLQNFKGIKSFTFNPECKNADIYGDNGTGKTTLYDAMLWLLFDKDSQNRKDFSIKPYDANGNEVHMIESVVEASFFVEDRPLVLRKMFAEKWTKKRGEAEKEFTGHETSYWIDDVPVKKIEYQSKINSLINEELFKLLTNPMYFMTLKWQDRRDMLLEIAGGLSDGDIMQSSPEFSRLPGILAGKSIEDYKKILNERIKKLNKEIEEIPLRIDELTKTLPQTHNYPLIEAELEILNKKLLETEQELTGYQKREEIQQRKQQQLFKLRNELDMLKRKLVEDANKEKMELASKKSALERQLFKLQSDNDFYANQINSNNEILKFHIEKRQQLLTEWKNLRAAVFVMPEENFVCPTCGQPLPEESKLEKIAELKASFELSKARNIEKNMQEGYQVKTLIEKYESDNALLQQKIESNNKAIAEISTQISTIDSAMPQGTVSIDDVFDPKCVALEAQIKDLQTELEKPVDDRTAELIQTKRELQGKIDTAKQKLFSKTVAENTNKRIDELKEEEKKLAKQISELEGQKFLIEKFIRAKVDILTDSINSKFRHVRWKLFDTQINGGLQECCEALVNTNSCWVPYSTNANNAGRINAGMDIINTLSNHYGVYAPVFVDNAESVTKLTDMDTQVIRLVVSEADKALRVECVHLMN